MDCLTITARIAKQLIRMPVKVMLFINKEITMANHYAIVRHGKRYGADQVNGIWAENIRSIGGKNVDVYRSHLNITIIPLLFDNYDQFVLTRKEQIRIANTKRHINEKKARLPRVKKDKKTGNDKFPSLTHEFVFTHSHDAMNTDESIRYCILAHEFIMNWFDECNIILAVIHLDEETPHIHIWVDYYNKFKNRFVQSILQDEGKTDIDSIRNAWQKKLEEEGFNLLKQDGSVVGAEHDGCKADKNKGDLKKQIVELTENVKSLLESKLVLKKENDVLKKQKSALISINKEKDVQVNEHKSKNTKPTNTLKHLKKILPPWHKYLNDVYGIDISKEMPPAERLKPHIESTLQNKKVSKTTDITIPSLLK